MRSTTAVVLSALSALAKAAQDSRTFAVLRFNGDGFMTEGRVDPIVSPGTASSHLHGIMGGNNFGLTVEGDQLLSSTCTSAKIANDRSNYWAPEVYFQDPNNGSFTKVPLFYQNVYYFFEPTDDDIVAFPDGLKMVSGNATTRTPPAFGGGSNLDASAGPIQPVQFTCPRTSYDPPSYPADSDGTMAGMQDPQNKGAGAGFPLYPCDGYASPLRADIHFPSCYNPEAGLDDYENNMAFPTITDNKQNCPSGWIHVPHIFFELYWNTPLFNDYWTPDGVSQPFVLSNGDRTGYSLHADFLSGWDKDTLNTIISTCNAGDAGMDTCPDIPGGLSTDNDCKIASAVIETLGIAGPLAALPGNNPVSGWGVTAGTGSSGSSSGSSSSYSAVKPTTTTAVGATTAASTSVSSPTTASEDTSSPTVTYEPSPYQATTTTAAVTSASGTVGSISAEEVGTSSVYIVWDIVTVTETRTVWAEETPSLARRDLNRHAARHQRSHPRRI